MTGVVQVVICKVFLDESVCFRGAVSLRLYVIKRSESYIKSKIIISRIDSNMRQGRSLMANAVCRCNIKCVNVYVNVVLGELSGTKTDKGIGRT